MLIRPIIGSTAVAQALRASSAPGNETRALHALREIASAMVGAFDLAAIAGLVAFHARDLLNANRVMLHLWDEEAGVLHELGSSEPGTAVGSRTQRVGEGLAGQAALQRSLLLVDDYPASPHALPSAVEEGVQSALAAPLLVADRLVGVMAARFTTRSALSDEQAQLVSLLAAQIAPVLESARLYAVQARLLDRERALREVSRALASDLDEARVLDLAVKHATSLLDVPYARVWLLEHGAELRCAAAEGFVYPGLVGERLPTNSLLGLSLSADILNVPDAPAHPAWVDDTFAQRTGLRGYLAVPIQRAGETLGVLLVMAGGVRTFRRADEQLLRGLADAVAVAVANARSVAGLTASEQRLRSTYEAIACGILIQDADGVILHANSAAEEVLGYSLDQMRDRSSSGLWKVIDEEGVERAPTQRRVIVAARTGMPARNFTTCIVRPNGERRWLQCNAVPMEGADKQIQVVTSFVDITDRKRAEEAMTHQALHDALTGLPNRVLLHDRLGLAIRAAQRDDTQLALLLVDLDGFKEVNDTLGHHAGDLLLQQVGHRIQAAVRASDTVARLGGDEFAILLPGARAEGAQRIAEHVHTALLEAYDLDGQLRRVGASIGVAVCPEHGVDVDTLLRRADAAMYVAKRNGGGSSGP